MAEQSTTTNPVLQHPTFKLVKERFPGIRLQGTEFRNQSALIVDAAHAHEVLAFLRNDSRCAYNFLSDVFGIDYLNYPGKMPGRFAVVYNLVSYSLDLRFFVKVYLDPSLPTDGVVEDPPGPAHRAARRHGTAAGQGTSLNRSRACRRGPGAPRGTRLHR